MIGKYVVQMLEGELESELVTKWAWDRERPEIPLASEATFSLDFPDWPRHEMADLADEPMARL